MKPNEHECALKGWPGTSGDAAVCDRVLYLGVRHIGQEQTAQAALAATEARTAANVPLSTALVLCRRTPCAMMTAFIPLTRFHP